MNKLWIIAIGIVAIAIVGFMILKGGGDTKTTTTTSETNSNETNGLLGAIAEIWGGLGSAAGSAASGS